ncbi:hypothetical protein [Escherichia coli]|uniref:hypothetical protein n=1 Tax=Escherichia coli TaxID=562 RepID=UPI001E610818|nr:hypothetical protein [Escherichia coli]
MLLIDDTDREDFQPHAAHITEGCGWMKISSADIWRVVAYIGRPTTRFAGFISGLFTHPALLRDVMHHLNSEDLFIPGFSIAVFFPALLSLHQKKAFFLCCWANALWPGE